MATQALPSNLKDLTGAVGIGTETLYVTERRVNCSVREVVDRMERESRIFVCAGALMRQGVGCVVEGVKATSFLPLASRGGSVWRRNGLVHFSDVGPDENPARRYRLGHYRCGGRWGNSARCGLGGDGGVARRGKNPGIPRVIVVYLLVTIDFAGLGERSHPLNRAGRYYTYFCG